MSYPKSSPFHLKNNYGSRPMPREYAAGMHNIPADAFATQSEPAPATTAGQYVCSVCNRSFTIAVALAGHMRTHK